MIIGLLFAWGSVLLAVSTRSLVKRFGLPTWSDFAGAGFMIGLAMVVSAIIAFAEGGA